MGCGEVKRTRAIPSTAQTASMQLNERAKAIAFLKFVAPVEIDDLTEQGDLLHASRGKLANFISNFSNRAAPLRRRASAAQCKMRNACCSLA